MSTPAAQFALYMRAFGALALTIVVYGLWVYSAHAQSGISYDQTFSCSGGSAAGELFGLSSRCPQFLTSASGSIDLEHIFSFFVCNVERITTALFGNLYCGMISALAPAIYAVATLAVLFFGIGFTTGILDFTARELLTFLMKIALFIVFTTEADYMIGIAYNFFISGAQQGITIALSGLYEGSSVCSEAGMAEGGGDLYCMLDNFLYTFLFDPITSVTAAVGADVESGANPCKNALIAALGLLAIAFPPIFYMALLILAKIAMVFVRGVYGYMFAIVGLAFLMVVSPIYLTFGLFRQTRPFFDKFLGYLASFSLQMIFVFTFLAFVLSLPLSHVSSSLLSIIVYQKTTYEGNTWRFPWEYCSICDFNIYQIVDPADPSQDILLDPSVKINSAKHRLKCKEPFKALEPLALVSPQPDGSGANPVAANQALQNKLMDFAMYGLLGLLVLALVIDRLLSLIPFLAQTLAGGMGASYAPMLGGGRDASGRGTMGREAVDLPFESTIRSVGDGFHSGFTRGVPDENGQYTSPPSNTISGMASGVTEASKALVAGTNRDPGMVGGLVRFLVNPQGGLPGAE